MDTTHAALAARHDLLRAALGMGRYGTGGILSDYECGYLAAGRCTDSCYGDRPEQAAAAYALVVERAERKLDVMTVANGIRTRVMDRASHCSGGYVRSFDTDYDCAGCYGCRGAGAEIGWSVGAFVWHVATGAARAELSAGVTAFQCLASVGAAVKAALSIGTGLAWFALAQIEQRNALQVGRWARVASRRGRAADVFGVEGEIVRIESQVYGGYYDRRAGHVGGSSSDRAALRVLGRDALVWVSLKALAPAVMPAAAAEQKRIAAEQLAARKALPADAAKGDFVYVIDGKHRGASGVVMWSGMKNRIKRVGVLPGVSALGRKSTGFGAPVQPIWLDACDVAKDAPAPVGTDLQVMAEVAILALARIVQLALDAAGIPIEARTGFAKPAKCTRRPRKAAPMSGVA